jgi:SOS-response transcriptional repressor LexA
MIDLRLHAEENDISIAALDGGFVVKRLVQVNDAVFLLSDNPQMAPIAITSQQFQIWGVVLFNLHVIHSLITSRFQAGERHQP